MSEQHDRGTDSTRPEFGTNSVIESESLLILVSVAPSHRHRDTLESITIKTGGRDESQLVYQVYLIGTRSR